ncbi:hypothetical protein BKA04_000007 [Cryobacterium mesophilum]|uniref:DUF1684 domain-containing protein n=1 Tax=Terrimesophilobacter mesophilus TaxID=433647 RepID=A0A4R8V7S8_9MICO|nr:DUF1684 domain-containing protein [Terrimesophilobacter mesophilus]MBB5631784.1 hypothetical protein [Terrimesophilobacter mesophilus]TFB78703.1 DUF1684 domain-containing protein [Terrimesophilobacter mesophilus]
MTDTATTTPDAHSPEGQFATFRERREQAVVQPKGNLALVNTQWIDSEQTVWNAPGTWAPLPAGESGLQLTASASDGIRLNGEVVDGTVIVRGKDSDEPGDIVFSDTVTGFVIAGATGGYALRVWDADSDAIQNFGGIDAYPYNPDWVVEAKFTELPGATMPFEHTRDEGRTREVELPGEISFSKDGVDYSLAAIESGRALQIVFSDATSGVDTYSVGRFLYVAPDASGRVTLDFNRAVLPPCGFSYAFNCPMPPMQNRFAVPIEAGEKNVLAKDGSLLH